MAAFREQYRAAINLSLTWQRTNANTWTAGAYSIIRWVVDDRGNKIRQYAAQYNGEPLHPEPHVDLTTPKRRCQDHAQLMALRQVQAKGE